MVNVEQLSRTSAAKIAVLVDPEKTKSKEAIKQLCEKIKFAKIDFILVGGSSVNNEDFETCLSYLNKYSSIPKIIFPGGPSQISNKADAFLLLSLISGRNPDYLIGHHVQSAIQLKKLNCPIISTGYILIDGGSNSAVSYISQTTPIPQSNPEIAVKTAIAGELLGQKAIFVDAGSGAKKSADVDLIKRIKLEINIPLIVGGGIKSTRQVEELNDAGADLIVIGNKIEEDIDFLLDIERYKTTVN